ncbi:putative Fructose-1-phosphate phosphatase YqaB [Verrucomicrobia bacterium]|nr:putative Fructose-1-phosphate phosphatase YqaB [Verrucomicrobiota bacterium]
MLRALIFDMDGVIVDSEGHHERAFLEVLREIGYGDKHGCCYADYVGRSDLELWADFLSRHKPAQTIAQLAALKRAKMVDIIARERPLFSDAPRLIQLVAARYALALASGSERPVVEAVLRLENLHRFFSVVVTDSDVKRGKPAPDILLRAADALVVAPAECCVIEDSKPGISAALAAGMSVVAITNTHAATELQQATHVVQTYAELERLLLEQLA